MNVCLTSSRSTEGAERFKRFSGDVPRFCFVLYMSIHEIWSSVGPALATLWNRFYNLIVYILSKENTNVIGQLKCITRSHISLVMVYN